MRRVIVTGGAGFIGSALVLNLLKHTSAHVLTIDKLTYAGNKASLGEAMRSPRHEFVEADIGDGETMAAVLTRFRPDTVFNLAAETHVDRSIAEPQPFVQTNVLGVATLLGATQGYFEGLGAEERDAFRFVHVSTDEVFGTLGQDGRFDEHSPYAPNSPYAASKAGGDHLVRAWHRTYGLPTLIAHCSNNYGPRQFPEKLIPLMILSALSGAPMPVYGDGRNVRDWVHVGDTVEGLVVAAQRGEPGGRYLFGGGNERRNVDVVRAICAELQRQRPAGGGYEHLIAFVEDRKGHDYRYALDDNRTRSALGWAPTRGFEQGLADTVAWYLANEAWWRPLLSRAPAG